jgi:hypothetical protein
MIQVLRVDAYDKRKFAYDPKPEVMFEVPIDPPEQMEGGGKRNKKGKHCHSKCGKKWEACEWIIAGAFLSCSSSCGRHNTSSVSCSSPSPDIWQQQCLQVAEQGRGGSKGISQYSREDPTILVCVYSYV